MTEEHKIEFDYKGIDKPDKQEQIIKTLNLAEDKIRTIYLERLETFNKDSLEQNPEPFRFLKKENCSLIAFVLPYEFNLSQAVQTYILSTPEKREEILITLKHSDLNDLDSYRKSYSFFYEKLLPANGFDKSQIMLETREHYESIEHNITLVSDQFDLSRYITVQGLKRKVIDLIKKEIDQFKTVNTKKLSYFAKDAYKFPFSLLDLKPLIELVNDDDFAYQLDQAMAAYHQNLFLPCAATLGVVLETLCLKILEENGVKKIKSGDTQLGKLKERLVNERIITRRDNTRLEVAYKMRNMASHTSPGATIKEDCHFMLNVINTIAFEYLQEN
ncbi:hypothetical protein J14TS2_45120 [Bacillus sp. J14TS2]|uniref:hypothetical protein n=1 Tax=Bacillus sp. J14TS2 TaxID=2807188 RepID=UPI001B13F15E|nr:hypothetical protein [Bacillus sp. J14TS2]GIN74037.1 hypothetical protein J14TS2_45120 [Bacillus sp. J14TS2]